MSPQKIRRPFALLSLAIVLAACGGGGGGGGTPAPGGSTPPPPAAAGPAITTQPVSQSVVAGQAVTFSVAADGTATGYQWQRDGKDIAGATGLTYTLANPQAADDGARFTAVASGVHGSTTSAAAVLAVSVPKGLAVVAGTPGGPGTLDGVDGRLSMPGILAVQPGGALYLIDRASGVSDAAALRTVDLATGALATVRKDAALGDVVAFAIDAAGNLYDIAPSNGATGTPQRPATAIYRTPPGGQRALFAGSAEEQGSADGNGASARFGVLQGLVLDSAGNLIVNDGGTKLRKVSPGGAVVTLAGGAGANAVFYQIQGLAVDGAGNVTVNDAGVLRTVTPAGVVTSREISTGYGGAPPIWGPGIVADAAGNVYTLDQQNEQRIWKITPAGLATEYGDLPRYAWGSGIPYTGFAIDPAGNLYVAAVNSKTILRIVPGASASTFAGRWLREENIDATGPAAGFQVLTGRMEDAHFELATDSQGNIYVGEADRVRKVAPAGVVTTLPLPPGDRKVRYYAGPEAIDGSVLQVANGVVARIDAAGVSHFIAGQSGVYGASDGAGARATFTQPTRLLQDAQGNIWMKDVIPGATFADMKTYLRRIAPDGTVTTVATDLQANPILDWCADSDGKVWAVDGGYNVVRIAADGSRAVVRQRHGVDEQISAIGCGAGGALYLAMRENTTLYSVRKLTQAGAETVIAGNPGAVGTRAGTPGSLGPIDAITVGADGRVYVFGENALVRILQ
jgi:sugar lactone lactonase YvrE